MRLAHRVAVITGAGSGIGRASALALARKGCHLALCDINKNSLTSLAQEVAGLGVSCSTHVLDVANRDAVRALPNQVIQQHGVVHLLINNAGVALGGRFEDVSEVDFDWLMAINFDGVVSMTRAFLPHLRRVDEARIVNLSSLFGLVSPPEQAAYSSSKFAVRGFSNALRHELEGSNVSVTVVHPGGVATAIARNARVSMALDQDLVKAKREESERLLRLPAARAADIIVHGIECNRARILVGTDAKFISLLERLMPVRYWNVLAAGIRWRKVQS
jgi:short-subunit dehydrogenase